MCKLQSADYIWTGACVFCPWFSFPNVNRAGMNAIVSCPIKCIYANNLASDKSSDIKRVETAETVCQFMCDDTLAYLYI